MVTEKQSAVLANLVLDAMPQDLPPEILIQSITPNSEGGITFTLATGYTESPVCLGEHDSLVIRKGGPWIQIRIERDAP